MTLFKKYVFSNIKYAKEIVRLKQRSRAKLLKKYIANKPLEN